MPSKKGVIEVQFNWIFILVAGALILIFFVSISQKGSKVSDEKRDIDIRAKLSTILVNAKQSTDTFHEIQIPKTEIDFDCSGYSIGGKAAFQIGESFSASKLKSSTLILNVWSKEWNLPYTITNFQYITSPDMKFILVYDNSQVGEQDTLRSLLPDNVTKTVVEKAEFDVTNLPDSNNYKIRIVTISIDPSLLALPDYMQQMKNEDVTAVMIDPDDDSDIDGYGNLNFYAKDSMGLTKINTSSFIGKEIVVGGIIADKIENYNCVKERAIRQFMAVSQIYRDKAEKLRNIYDANLDNYCHTHIGFYTNSKEYIKTMMENIERDMSVFTGNLNNLKTANQNLDSKSCARVY